MASDQFGSGGGFSLMFNASSYQSAAVAAYLKQASTLPKFPRSGSFPITGRATPDIAGLGEGYDVISMGSHIQVGGTSCSSPMVGFFFFCWVSIHPLILC